MSLPAKIAALLATVVVCLATGWGLGIRYEKGQTAIRNMQIANERERQLFMRHERQNTAAAKHEADKERIRIEYVPITKTVEKIVEKPFYRDACLDNDGLRVLRDAISGSVGPSKPDAELPRPAKP